MRGFAGRLGSLAALVLSACSPMQSALSPEEDTACAILRLFWFFTAVCAAVWLIVMIALALVGLWIGGRTRRPSYVK